MMPETITIKDPWIAKPKVSTGIVTYLMKQQEAGHVYDATVEMGIPEKSYVEFTAMTHIATTMEADITELLVRARLDRVFEFVLWRFSSPAKTGLFLKKG